MLSLKLGALVFLPIVKLIERYIEKGEVRKWGELKRKYITQGVFANFFNVLKTRTLNKLVA